MQVLLNFVTAADSGQGRLVLDNGWTETGQRSVRTGLTDARPNAASLSLDREGFALDRVVSGVTDFRDATQIAER